MINRKKTLSTNKVHRKSFRKTRPISIASRQEKYSVDNPNHEYVSDNILKSNVPPAQRKLLIYNNANVRGNKHTLQLISAKRSDYVTNNKPINSSFEISNQSDNTNIQKEGNKSEAKKPISANTPTPERLKVRGDLHLLLDRYSHNVDARLTDWHIAARNIGSAYAIAAERHKKAIDDRAQGKALETALVFGILTAACTGGLGWIAGLVGPEVGTAVATAIDIENLQDTIVAVVSEGIDVGQMAAQPQSKYASQIPLVFQNEAMNKIDTLRKQVQSSFAIWIQSLLLAPMKNFDDSERLTKLAAAIDRWQQESSFLKGGSDLPPIEQMADELERGIWAEWCKKNLIYQQYISDVLIGSNMQTVHAKPGRAVEARLNELGVTKQSGVDDFGWWTDDEEIEKIVSWAETYSVEVFI